MIFTDGDSQATQAQLSHFGPPCFSVLQLFLWTRSNISLDGDFVDCRSLTCRLPLTGKVIFL